MSQVVNLKGEEVGIDARCAEVADMYQRLADRARAGGIVSGATCFVNADGTIGTLWQATGMVYQTIGAASVLVAEMTGARDTE